MIATHMRNFLFSLAFFAYVFRLSIFKKFAKIFPLVSFHFQSSTSNFRNGFEKTFFHRRLRDLCDFGALVLHIATRHQRSSKKAFGKLELEVLLRRGKVRSENRRWKFHFLFVSERKDKKSRGDGVSKYLRATKVLLSVAE
jgi:hypothetical protein